ncbi:MAG TPA: UvrD-helicase domain-containing protein [Ktedonobacteraceae bacterium]|nr:UvrD-helicase domain-containing protein [Ktedonobacteraceae bacterium]
MSGDVLTTDAFERGLSQLSHTMQTIAMKKIRLLAENPKHPSLNTHRIRQIKADVHIWDCYITESIRLLYEVRDGMLYLWDLGKHAIVDNVHLRSFAANTRFSHRTILPDVLDVSPASAEEVTKLHFDWNPVPVTPVLSRNELKGSKNFLTNFQTAHLRILGVPAHLVQRIKDAPTLEAALALSGLPERSRLWLEDLSTSVELEEVMFDSSRLLYRSTLDRLEGFCEGKIKRLMLNLQRPEQQQYVEMERTPLILLKGAAGSGKTTVGIYRAIRLVEQGRRVLVVTFNKTLASVTRSLIEELIGPLPKELVVTHLHSLMMALLRRRSLHLNLDTKEQQLAPRLLEEALHEVRRRKNAPVLLRERDFFHEEIKRVINGLGLKSVEEYKEVERYGRKTALNAKQREVVWEVYSTYQRKLAQAKHHDWSDVAPAALQSLQEKPFETPFDDIIVDEAQDLVPVDLRVIQHLVKPGGSVMILADAAQTLYSRGFSWKQAGIQARGRTAILRKNFRNTRQVAEASAYLLEQNKLMRSSNEYVDPEWTQRQGSSPIVMKATSRFHQIEIVRDHILDLVSDQTFRLSDFAVLCLTNELCRQCKGVFEQAGLRTVHHEDSDFDLLEERIKVLTIHSAKGLEFPVVFLLGLINGEFPSGKGMQHLDREEVELFIEQQRTLCYVGMTRAAEALYLLTVKGQESRFIKELTGKVNVWA